MMWFSSLLYLAAQGSLVSNDTSEKIFPSKQAEVVSETERSNSFLRVELPDPEELSTGPTVMSRKESLAGLSVENFNLLLSKYANENSFGVESFTSDLPYLFKEFAKINKFAEDVSLSKDVTEQLKFTQHLFTVMVHTSRSLERYTFTGNSKQHLVYCMIEMSVRLLAMYNSKGFPNVHMPQYAYKVNRFSEVITILRTEFKKLSDVSYEMQDIFKTHSVMAQKELNVLRSYIPFLSEFFPID